MKYAHIGTVSHGTLKPDDLIPAFAEELEYQLQRNPEFRPQFASLLAEAEDCDHDHEDVLLEDLIDALQGFAHPDHYFGASDGDGSDFGFWKIDLCDY
jgi:hypothetical protein